MSTRPGKPARPKKLARDADADVDPDAVVDPESGWRYLRDRDYAEIFSKPQVEGIRKEIGQIVGRVGSVLDCGGGLRHLEKHLDCETYVCLDFCAVFEPDILADLKEIPLEDKSYDVCVTKNVLQHILEWRKALSEVVRLARQRVVLAERTISGPSRVVSRKPVLMRQFNRDVFKAECEKYGRVSFKLADADSRVGIYEVFLL